MADQKDPQVNDLQKTSQPKQPLAESTPKTDTRLSKEKEDGNRKPSDRDKIQKQEKGKKKRGNGSEAKPSLSETKSKSDLEVKEGETKDETKLSSENVADEASKDEPTNDTSTVEKKDIEEESEDEGIEDLGNLEELDGAGRNALFERANQYDSKGKKKCALKCYLKCLTGLKDTVGFSFLPQCLRRVADLYFEKEEFEKAIQFIQAEKMFYETALIDTSQLQTKLELAQQVKEVEEGASTETTDPETLRADEYEKLARLCIDKKQPKLALEYQGKATKIRQKLYGDSDARTVASLDFFTVVYAQVGKQQYAESLEKMDGKAPAEGQDENPTSILRKRKAKTEETEENGEKKQVRFENPPVTKEQTFTPDPSIRNEAEEWWAHTILLVLFVLCALCLCGVSMALYCRSRSPYTASTPCNTARIQLRHAWNVVGFYWQHYVMGK